MIKVSRSLVFLPSLFIAAALVGCASTQTAKEEPAPAPAAETKPAPVAQPAPTPAPREEVVTGPKDDSYQVAPGDHLWGIAGKASVYGDPYRWPLIYKANQDKIDDADLIHPGQTLAIRRGNTPAEIDAAILHARTRGAWTLGAVEPSDRAFLNGSRLAATRN